VDGTLYYLHADPTHTMLAVSDAQGNGQGHLWYDPHGSVLTSTLPAALTDRLFTGARFDGTIGLYQMGARWYDPALGRWIQADTIVPNPTNPQDLNRYTYVRNNPLRYTDPSGHWIFEGGPGDSYFIGPWLYEAQRRQDFITSHAPTTGEFVAVVTSPFWASGLALGFETMAIGLWEAGAIAYETVTWWVTMKWIEIGLRIEELRAGVNYDPSLPASEGFTDKFGNMTISPRGTSLDQSRAFYHELVHHFFTPRGPLQPIRADIRMWAYSHSHLLRYMEEAIAESTSQMLTGGSFQEGLLYPIKYGYVSSWRVLLEADGIFAGGVWATDRIVNEVEEGR
jgi:RHS repeat-associated protein